MVSLTLDEIVYITRFLDLKNTFNFIKSLNLELTKTMVLKNRKLNLIENVYNSYLNNSYLNIEKVMVLKEIIEKFYQDIDLEDLICFMANVYPNNPYLKDTILFDLLKLYKNSMIDWSLIRVHFKIK
jgi:hypothetical protein